MSQTGPDWPPAPPPPNTLGAYPPPNSTPGWAPPPPRAPNAPSGYVLPTQPPASPPGYFPYPQVRSPLQWRAYARTCFDAGQPVAKVVAEMTVSGVPPQAAFGIVAEVVAAMRKRAWAIIAGGGIVVAVGLLVTFTTMAAAQDAAESSRSGMYVVWWGPVVAGAIAAAYGLRELMRVPRLQP